MLMRRDLLHFHWVFWHLITSHSRSTGARHLFDGMPRRRKNKKRKGVAAESGKGRIGALPDALLHDVLSFLPSHEAGAPSGGPRPSCASPTRGSPAEFNKFVNNLPLSRDPSPLHEFQFCAYTHMVQMLSPAFADSMEPIRYSRISAHQMSSQSLKHLYATG